MDPVDVLTAAVVAAQEIRSAADPEAVIAGAYGVLGLHPPTDRGEAMAIRVARLMSDAGGRRSEVLALIRKHVGPLPWNRPDRGWGKGADVSEPLIDPDPEALRLLKVVEEGAGEAVPMVPAGFGPFEIAGRKSVGWFDSPVLVKRLENCRVRQDWEETEPHALEEIELGELPSVVRGLIDYPLGVPVLFPIETGVGPWSLWDIFCAFADRYAEIYEHPDRYGVSGHDLTDLWIEGMVYFPSEQLIYAEIGS